MIAIPIFQPSKKFQSFLVKVRFILKSKGIKKKILIINDGTNDEKSKKYLYFLKRKRYNLNKS